MNEGARKWSTEGLCLLARSAGGLGLSCAANDDPSASRKLVSTLIEDVFQDAAAPTCGLPACRIGAPTSPALVHSGECEEALSQVASRAASVGNDASDAVAR